MNQIVTQTDFIGSDPFAGFLFKRGIQPWQVALFVFLVGLFYLGPLSLVFGIFFPRPDLVSSWVDRFNQVNFLFVFPAAGYFYTWQSLGAARAYQAVIDLFDAEEQQQALNAIREMHLHRRWWLFGLGIAILTVILGVADNLASYGKFWYSANGVMIVIIQAARFYTLFVIINSITRHLAVSANLNRLFSRLSLPVAVTETRQSRALEVVSGYAMAFAVLGAIAGLNIGLQPVLEPGYRPEYAIFVVLYFTLVPLGFFLPFFQARIEMVESKNLVMNDLRAKYQLEYEILVRSVQAENPEEAEKSAGRLKTIEEAIQVTDRAPTWPFELLSVYRLSVTVVLPFALAAMNFVFDMFDRFFNK